VVKSARSVEMTFSESRQQICKRPSAL